MSGASGESAAEARYPLVCTPTGLERRFDLMAAEQAGAERLSLAIRRGRGERLSQGPIPCSKRLLLSGR
jgi:hypothetical protein